MHDKKQITHFLASSISIIYVIIQKFPDRQSLSHSRRDDSVFAD